MNSNAKHNKKRNNSIFYTVLSLCLIAVGVAAWSAASAFDDFKNEGTADEPDPPAVVEPEIIVPEPEKPAGNDIDDVEYTPPKAEAPSDETKTEGSAFIMPISGDIIKIFDSGTLQYSATLGDMRLHEGLDIAADEGTLVRAVRGGTVTEIYEDTAYGYTIVIDHGDGIIAKYCGMNSAIPVSVGQELASGAEIGTLGRIPIEAADGSHLHLEMLQDNNRVSPLSVMGMQ